MNKKEKDKLRNIGKYKIGNKINKKVFLLFFVIFFILLGGLVFGFFNNFFGITGNAVESNINGANVNSITGNSIIDNIKSFFSGESSTMGDYSASQQSPQNYYVWAGVGNDANDGSAMDLGHAWASLAHADDIVGPGDIIYLKGNFTTQQSLNNASGGNGNSSSWVTYRPYDDNFVDFTGDNSGIRFDNKQYVKLDGFYNTNKRFRFYNGTLFGIYIRGSSNNIEIRGSNFNPSDLNKRTGGGIRVFEGANHININNNRIESGQGSDPSAIYLGTYGTLNDCSYVSVYDNDLIASTKDGIGVYDCNAIDIKDLPNAQEIFIYNNNISFYTNISFGAIEVSGSARIYNNSFTILTNGSKYAAPFYIFSDANLASSVYIYGNNFIGGSNKSALFTVISNFSNLDVYFYNNLIQNYKGSNNYIAYYNSFNSGRLKKLLMYHNTFYNNSGLSGDYYEWNPIQTNIFKNNLFVNWGTYAFTDSSNINSSWNGNYYYKLGVSNSTNAFTLDSVARSFIGIQGLGQEINGTFGLDPNLSLSGKLIYSIPVKINVSSEMFGWPDYNKDIEGNLRGLEGEWDIGAYESNYSKAINATCEAKNTSKCWYVDNQATGSNNGSSWNNAYKNFSSINWASVKPGDFIYISGGNSEKIYTETMNTQSSDGNITNSIKITSGKDAGHNGKVIIDCKNIIQNGVNMAGSQYLILSGNYNNQRNIIIKNCTLQGISGGELLGSIIEYLEIRDSNNGISVYANTPPGGNNGLDIKNNNISGIWGDHAINLNNLIEAFDSVLVHDNEIQLNSNMDGNGTGPDGIQASAGVSIYNNHIYAAKGQLISTQHQDGIQAMSNYIKVYNNTFENIGNAMIEGGSIGSTAGYWRIYNNIFAIKNANIDSWQRGFEWSPNSAIQKLTDIKIYNNNFVDFSRFHALTFTLGTGYYGSSNVSVEGLEIINNIFYNSGMYPGVVIRLADGNYSCGSGVIINNNLINAGADGATGIVCDNQTYSQPQGILGDPLFVKYIKKNETNDFRLQNSSPAIDSGVNVGLPYLGNAPDIGAYESNYSKAINATCEAKNTSKCWYVDNAAVGSNNGSSWNNAYKNFSSINWASVKPGDFIYISGGSLSKTYYETLNIGASGNSTARITIRPGLDIGHDGYVVFKGNFTPLISNNGTNPPNSDSTRYGIYGNNLKYVTIDGSDLNNERKIRFENVNRGIYFESTTLNCSVRYVNVTNSYIAVYVQNDNGSLVEFVDARGLDGGGIRISGEYHRPHTSIVRNNYLEVRFYDGISIDSGVDVYNNWVRKADNEEWTTPTHYSHPDGIPTGGSDNYIWNNRIDGFEQNIYVQNIMYYSTGLHETLSNTHIWNNIITNYSIPNGSTVVGQYGIVIHAEQGDINGTYIYGNTMVNPIYGIQTATNGNYAIYNIISKNNILGRGYSQIVVNVDKPTFVSDYNLFQTVSSGYNNGTQYFIYDLPTWKNITKLDSHSILGDPLFVNLSTNDFHLKNESSAIDAGVDLGVYYNFDADGVTRPRGNAWDIGAYESNYSRTIIMQNTPADVNYNGCVNNTEFGNYLTKWVQGNVDSTNFTDATRAWISGGWCN